MIKANEARKAYEVKVEERTKAKKAKAYDICEDLGKEIENASNNLRTTYNTKAIDADVIAFVIQRLECYGYKVHKHNDRTLNIAW
jgi:hypothetical protein